MHSLGVLGVDTDQASHAVLRLLRRTRAPRAQTRVRGAQQRKGGWESGMHAQGEARSTECPQTPQSSRVVDERDGLMEE